jgi:hypothetical protein
MVRPALLPVAVLGLVVLAGCTGTVPGFETTTTTATPEAKIVGSYHSGGKCVENPMQGFDISNTPGDTGRIVTVAANVTVPGAHYTIDRSPTLTTTGTGSYRLDVNTTESAEKPPKDCEKGGIVHYEVTVQVPETDSFELAIRHNGQTVSRVGSGET